MRIQIVELPRKSVGQAHETSYAVVVSEIPIIDDEDPGKRSGATECAGIWESKLLDGGADWALFTSERVEIDSPQPEKTPAQAGIDYFRKNYGIAQGGYVGR